MAYPNSVIAFGTKNAGDVIQPAHVNDLQTEVTAVENGLLNGLAHAVSIAGALTVSTGGMTVSTGSVNIGGPSSLTTLQVNGGSTFVGTVACSSNVTVAGSLTVGGVNIAGTAIFNKAIHSTVYPSIANNTWTGLNFDGNQYGSGSGIHSTTTNSSRHILTSSGLWIFGGQVNWTTFGAAPSTLAHGSKVLLNDTTTLIQSNAQGVALAQPVQHVMGHYYATSTTDYLVFQVWQNSASTASISGADSTTGRTHFWVQKVG